MRKRKKRLQKWPLWRVRVWESISSMFPPTFPVLAKVASLPYNTGQNKGQCWEYALCLFGIYRMLSRDLMEISFCKWSGSSKWMYLVQKERTRTATFPLQMIRIIHMNWPVAKRTVQSDTILLQMIQIIQMNRPVAKTTDENDNFSVANDHLNEPACCKKDGW